VLIKNLIANETNNNNAGSKEFALMEESLVFNGYEKN